MTSPLYDVVAIGNAIVDVMAPATDADLARLGLPKGGMTLIDEVQAHELYAGMAPGQETSGGSAANTLAGLAALGAKCAFVGQVGEDQLGEVFAHDIRAGGVHFATPAISGTATARCLILVTPDAQRTMNTFLGASQLLPAAALDAGLITAARVLYLEGYLWDPEGPRAAMRAAIAAARGAGTEVALTLSDGFVIARHGDDFRALLAAGDVDILFANEVELAAMAGTEDFEAGLAALAPQVKVLVATRGAHGAVALRGGERAMVPAAPVAHVVDTTGAGDLFAAGFLYGHARQAPLGECLRLGAVCAGEIISHYGARPEGDLKALIGVG